MHFDNLTLLQLGRRLFPVGFWVAAGTSIISSSIRRYFLRHVWLNCFFFTLKIFRFVCGFCADASPPRLTTRQPLFNLELGGNRHRRSSQWWYLLNKSTFWNLLAVSSNLSVSRYGDAAPIANNKRLGGGIHVNPEHRGYFDHCLLQWSLITVLPQISLFPAASFHVVN